MIIAYMHIETNSIAVAIANHSLAMVIIKKYVDWSFSLV